MSIGYPHQVQVRRAGASTAEDELGRDSPGAVASSGSPLAAWVQSKAAEERRLVTDAGEVISTHTIFVYDPSRTIRSSDTLRTVAVGGQIGNEDHEILGIREPDGSTHHREIDTVLITRAS